MKAKDFEVGQILFRVPRETRYSTGPTLCKVYKVGRKWVTVTDNLENVGYDPDRFDPSDAYGSGFPLDGGNYSSPGTIYLSKEAYDQELDKSRLESMLRKVFSGYRKTEYSLDQLQRIVAILEE